jgi:hypothetical protein
VQVDAEGVEALRATFEAAMAFGLTDEQVWVLVNKVSYLLPPDTALDAAVERLTADLANAIIRATAILTEKDHGAEIQVGEVEEGAPRPSGGSPEAGHARVVPREAARATRGNRQAQV